MRDATKSFTFGARCVAGAACHSAKAVCASHQSINAMKWCPCFRRMAKPRAVASLLASLEVPGPRSRYTAHGAGALQSLGSPRRGAARAAEDDKTKGTAVGAVPASSSEPAPVHGAEHTHRVPATTPSVGRPYGHRLRVAALGTIKAFSLSLIHI